MVVGQSGRTVPTEQAGSLKAKEAFEGLLCNSGIVLFKAKPPHFNNNRVPWQSES